MRTAKAYPTMAKRGTVISVTTAFVAMLLLTLPWLVSAKKHLSAQVEALSPSGSTAPSLNPIVTVPPVTVDLDEDGVPDLVRVAADGSGIGVHKGIADAPKQTGQATAPEALFAGESSLLDLPEAPDFLGAGDFNSDGHYDVVVGRRRSRNLYWMAGNGRGVLSTPHRLELPGVLTALTTGEINRRDGLTDVVVGVLSDGGAEILVFEGPEGAFRATPERLPVSSQINALALAQFDNSYEMDLAALSPAGVQFVAGRDRKLSLSPAVRATVKEPIVHSESLSFLPVAMTPGDFTGDSRTDLALLSNDGRVHLLQRTDELRPGSISNESQNVPLLLEAEAAATWRISLSRYESAGPSPANTPLALSSARISGGLKEDLLLIADEAVKVLRFDNTKEDSRLAATYNSSGLGVWPFRRQGEARDSLVLVLKGLGKLEIISPQAATTFIVTNTNDSGAGSLRQAIIDANANSAADTINFDIPGSGVQTISLVTQLPALTEAVTINGYTQSGSQPNTLQNGNNAILNIELTGVNIPVGLHPGLVVSAPNCVIKGLVINRFDGSQIQLHSANNVVQGNFINTDPTGTIRRGRAASTAVSGGVETSGASSNNNLIGGTTPDARNLISASGSNTPTSVVIPAGTGNLVQGNYIGTNKNGTAPIDTTTSTNGVVIQASGNTVGGTQPGAGNLISCGFGTGVSIFSTATTADILIQGNLIGTDATGSVKIGNSTGVSVGSAIGVNGVHTIGGTTPAARNIISGNGSASAFSGGVLLSGPSNILIQGNYIGLDITGSQKLGNQTGGVVIISNAKNNTVGGVVAAAGNVISGNNSAGVKISSTSGAGVSGNTVQGNLIGTGPDGTTNLGNGDIGVDIGSSTNTTVGGIASGAGNIIAFSGRSGVRVSQTTGNGSPGSGNTVRGNSIFSNGNSGSGLGIDIGNDGFITPNDPADPDSGANGLQNFPIISVVTDPPSAAGKADLAATEFKIPSGHQSESARTTSDIDANQMLGISDVGNEPPSDPQLAQFRPARQLGPGIQIATSNPQAPVVTKYIQGTLNSTASTTFAIDFYVNPACSSSSFGEGKTYIGSADVTTDSNGDSSFSVNIAFDAAAGNSITATATDPNGNTSEFSQCSMASGTNADVGITVITDTPDPVTVGQDLTYTVTLINVGPAKATNVVFSQELRADVEFVSSTISQGVCNNTGTANICDIGTLNAQVTVRYTAIVRPQVTGTLRSGDFRITAAQNDPQPNNNAFFVNTNVDPVRPPGTADLRLTTSANPQSVPVGANINLNVAVQNLGPDTATGITVTDTLIPEFTFVSASSGCSFDSGSRVVTCDFGSIQKPLSVLKTITVTANTPGQFSNTATITAATPNDVNPGDNSASASVVVGAGPLVLVVTNTDDSGFGSLRQAILDSNGNPGTDTISFNIPGDGVHTIAPLTSLPLLMDAVVIDGYTQPGTSKNTSPTGTNAILKIELSGINLNSTSNGLSAFVHGSTIRGLIINRFSGVTITNTEFGTGFLNGAAIIALGGQNTVVEGCFIGTDATGTEARDNAIGIILGSSGARVGGTTPESRNLISGNTIIGIGMNPQSNQNVVQGNLIGTNATGTSALKPSRYDINGFYFLNAGLTVNGANNTIGGTAPGARNIISGHRGRGVSINRFPNAKSGNMVQGNLIGTDVSSTKALPNSDGVVVDVMLNTLVGGAVAGAGNVISGNQFTGVLLQANNSTVQGNFIGTDITGTQPLGNFNGVRISVAFNTVGGGSTGAGNVIAANRGNGIVAFNSANLIQGNKIGTDKDGNPLGNLNHGILIPGDANNPAGRNTISDNTIAYNGLNGIRITSTAQFNGTGNPINGNKIFANGGSLLGIDLGGDGVSANDADDVDFGANEMQNFPVLTSAVSAGGSTTLQGTLNSLASKNYSIDFFSNTSCDPSGNGEGQIFLGSTTVVTNASGNATINSNLPVVVGGRFITATSTLPVSSSGVGGTSEFSACIQGTGESVPGPTPTPTPLVNLAVALSDSPDPATTGSVVTYAATVSNSGPATATAVRLDSVLTPGISLTSADATQGTCNAAGSSAICNLGTMASGASVVVTFVGTASATGFVTNTTSVSSTETDTNSANNTAGEDTSVNQGSAVSINDVSVGEGNAGTTPAVFNVTLTPASSQPVTVDFGSADETALAGSDYQTTLGTLTFAPGETSKTITVLVNGDVQSESNQTFRISLGNLSGAIFSRRLATGTIIDDDESPTTLQPGQVLISEFRFHGSAGAADEFVELYNNTDSAVDISGCTVFALDSGGAQILTFTVPGSLGSNTTTIPARGHYLIANNSPGGYSLAAAAAPDGTFTSDILDGSGIGLFAGATPVAGNRVDSVGFDVRDPLFFEGVSLTPVGGIATDGEFSFVRKMALTGLPRDTDDNAGDFTFVSTDGGLYGGMQSGLGAPGPENLSSPIQHNATIKAALIDPGCAGNGAANTACARARDTTSDVPNNSTFGTLSLRRKFTNNTSQMVTRLRFRVVDITTAPQASNNGIADVRLRTSPSILGATLSGGGTTTIQGLTLEEAPTQPNGGGLNSTVSAGTITVGAPLAPGASINVSFLLGVQQTGSYRFYVNVEALP